MDPYSYSAETRFNLQPEKAEGNWRQYRFDFLPAFPTTLHRSTPASGTYLHPPDDSPAPLAILLHGMGDRNLVTLRRLAQTLVTREIACVVLNLLVHPSRIPESMIKRFPILTPEEWFEAYQTSVIEVRQVIDWATSRQEIDESRIAVLGVSFGGFISVIAMGVDERIKAGVFIITGGNSEKINRMGGLNKILRTYRRPGAEYKQIQQSYLKYLDEVSEKGIENVTPPRKTFLADPLTFAHRLRQRPVLMLNALFDELVPREAAKDLWDRIGRPAIRWFPATHSTIWLWLPRIRRHVADFLTAALGMSS